MRCSRNKKPERRKNEDEEISDVESNGPDDKRRRGGVVVIEGPGQPCLCLMYALWAMRSRLFVIM